MAWVTTNFSFSLAKTEPPLRPLPVHNILSFSNAMKTPRTLALAALAVGLATPAAALSVDVTSDAATLAGSLSLDGVALVGEPTFTGPEGSAGVFSGGTAAGLAADTGLLLSNGFAADAAGPNQAADAGDGAGGPGSSEADAALGLETFDVATFTTSFTLTDGPGTVTVSYLFGTDEFPEFLGEDVNDSALVFLDGVLLDTASADTSSLFDNAGEVDALGFLVPGSAPLDVELDGISGLVTATSGLLDEGPHTLSFVIADVGDPFIDSALLIEGISAEVIPTPGAFAGGLALLAAGAARRRQRQQTIAG